MESNTYKLRPKKLKGSWAMYILILGVFFLFVNVQIAFCITLIAGLLVYKFKSNPENVSIFNYNLALKLYSQKQFGKVKGLLKNAIEYDNNNKEAFFFLGTILFDEKDYTNALKFLTKGGADKVNDASLIYILGRCYYHVESYEKSIHYLSSIEYSEESPFECARLYTLGRAYFELEDYDKAVECFDRFEYTTEELKGEALEYNYYLGVTYFYVDRDDKAKEIIQKVYEVDNRYKNIDVYAKDIGLI